MTSDDHTGAICASIPDYVDRNARVAPDSIAIEYLDESLSHEELSCKSSQLANKLIQLGVGKSDRVGIFMEKNIHTAVALFGIMKAGAAYVPLDPAAPVARIASLLNDCGIRHLVSSNGKRRQLIGLSKTTTPLEWVVGVDQDDDYSFQTSTWNDVAQHSAESPQDLNIQASDLAYIIYTSGSTGSPKGIMHTHDSGLSFAHWAVAEFQLTRADRLSNHAPLHFDLSIFDYFAAAVSGASTVIIPEEYTKVPASYTQLLADRKVTVLFTVPFALIQMLLHGSLENRDLSSLRWALFGGEPFPSVHLRRLLDELPHVQFDNVYGPAEINGCSHYTVKQLEADDEPVPIGKMAGISRYLIVDNNSDKVERGGIGELIVNTPTMMQGYWNREALNKAAFSHRKCGDETITFYRTGDLVQELADGVLRFVGRRDRQIKVRGYRIELDEVELALTAIESVEEAAVYALVDGEGQRTMHAEVTLKQGQQAEPSDLLSALKKKLSWYAIPSQISISSQFPRTVTGKIDRRLLSEHAQQSLTAAISNNKSALS